MVDNVAANIAAGKVTAFKRSKRGFAITTVHSEAWRVTLGAIFLPWTSGRTFYVAASAAFRGWGLKLRLKRLSPFSRCEIMLNFWYYLKWSQVTSWATDEHTETLSCSEFLDWLSFIPSLTSSSSLFFIQLLIPSTGLILLPRPFFCPSIPPARLDSAESLPAVTTLTATRGKKDQKHTNVSRQRKSERKRAEWV